MLASKSGDIILIIVLIGIMSPDFQAGNNSHQHEHSIKSAKLLV